MKQSPFPWTARPTTYGTTNLLDANGIKFGNVFASATARRDGQETSQLNAAMITALPLLLKAAMRGHGWGDPVHQQAMPNCYLCAGIRQAIGPLTRERVIELAKLDCDHVSELIFDDNWNEVWIHLGIHPESKDADYLKRAHDGEYEGLDAELIKVLPTL